MPDNRVTVTINYNPANPANNGITLTPDPVEIRRNGVITFSSPDADAVVVCGDNSSLPKDPSQGWFVSAVDQGADDRNDIAFFVPRGGTRNVRVKNSNAIVALPGQCSPNYKYTVVVLTQSGNGERDAVTHDLDPTVIIRDN